MRKNPFSWWAVAVCWVALAASSLMLYPKWRMNGNEATIGWDVSGYYFYLPAVFIYDDLRGLGFYEDVLNKYQPTPGPFQAEKWPETGHYIMSYPCGQAVQYWPFFTVGHWAAKALGYPADGFSRPYQLAITLGMLAVALLGLWLLRRLLLRFFSDKIVAAVVVSVALGTNYFDYAGITGAMTHNGLFTILTAVILLTLRFYERPTYRDAAFIGLLIGLAALTRPTEIMMALVPLLYRPDNRLSFRALLPKVTLAAVCTLAVGSVQLFYWKYVTGHWVVYHYSGDGFDFKHPHIFESLLGFNVGWLIYSPVMWFAVIGTAMAWRRLPRFFPAVPVFLLLFMYVTFSWKVWWYGGSLGHRAMIQSYPIWALGLGVFFEGLARARRYWRYVVAALWAAFVYQNLWLTYQAHGGGLFHTGQMTQWYFARVWGQFDVNPEHLKLLDTKEIFEGERHDITEVYRTGFEADTFAYTCALPPIEGQKSLFTDGAHEFSPRHMVPLKKDGKDWLRVRATFRSTQREWEFWAMPNFKVFVFDGEATVQTRMFRPSRFMTDNDTRELYLDVPLPRRKNYDRIGIEIWSAGNQKPFAADNLIIETFNE